MGILFDDVDDMEETLEEMLEPNEFLEAIENYLDKETKRKMYKAIMKEKGLE